MKRASSHYIIHSFRNPRMVTSYELHHQGSEVLDVGTWY